MFFSWSSIVIVCFSEDLPGAEQVNLACSVICFWLEVNIYSPVRHSYLSTLPDDRVDMFVASPFFMQQYIFYGSSRNL